MECLYECCVPETRLTRSSNFHFYRKNSGLIWNVQEDIPLNGGFEIHPSQKCLISKNHIPVTSLSEKWSGPATDFFAILYANN